MTFMARTTTRYYLGMLVTLLIIAGCGGGGDGGGTGPSLVGTYIGTATLTARGPGGTATETGAIQFVVSADGTVSVGDPGQPPFGTGTLSGTDFVINIPASILNEPGGLTCTGTIIFNGTISVPTMSGTVSSSGLRCNGQAVELSGTFTATLRAEVPTGTTSRGITQVLRNAVRPH